MTNTLTEPTLDVVHDPLLLVERHHRDPEREMRRVGRSGVRAPREHGLREVRRDGAKHRVDLTLAEVADRLHDLSLEAGREILYDDRDESPGVKFTDAELLGMPTLRLRGDYLVPLGLILLGLAVLASGLPVGTRRS